MGMFSSKKETVVSTGAVRVIEDKYLPNALRFGMLKGVFANDGQMSNYILEETLNGIALKAEQMYRYGKTKYVHGVPEMVVVGSISGENLVKGILENQLGKSISFEYFHYGVPNSLHQTWIKLQNSFQYSKSSNEIKALSDIKGFPVYLEDIVIVIPEAEYAASSPEAFALWGSPAGIGVTPLRRIIFEHMHGNGSHTPIQISNTAEKEHAIIKCIWEEVITETIGSREVTRKVIKREDLIILLDDIEDDLNYVQAVYFYDSTLPIVGAENEFGGPVYQKEYVYFSYKENEGTYPEIDGLYNPSYEGLGSFFPRAYFRDDKKSLTDDTSSDVYKSTKKLLKYLGLNYGDIASALKENPDVADIWQSLIMMAVPGESTNQIECRYLFDFFKKVYIECGIAGAANNTPSFTEFLKNNMLGLGTTFALIIQDQKFKMVLGLSKAKRSVKVGNIGEIGFCDNRTKIENDTYQYLDEYQNVLTGTNSFTWHYYRKQITASMYEEIGIRDLRTKYNVYNQYYTSSEDEENILLIPLDYSISSTYGNQDREELYARSLHFVFNAVERIKVKWYQQEWFQFVLFVVAVIYIAFTWDSSGFMAILGMAGDYMTAALLIAQGIIVAYAESLIIKWVIDAIGIDLAMVLAVVLIVYGGFEKYFGSSGVQGAPWAESFMKISTGLVKQATDAITEKMLGLKNEAEAFGIEAQEKMKLLDEANELLWSENIFAPFILPNESPDIYYQRTVHSGNIGVRSLDSVSSYVSNALTLPTFSESVRIA
jgi:hypothetical protein